MKVYYRDNFWGCMDAREVRRDREEETDRNRIPGTKLPLGLRFTYSGAEYRIPAMYLFPEGVTVDIIQIIDEQEEKERCRVYEEEYASMDAEDQVLFENSSDLHTNLPLGSLTINGKQARMIGTCSAVWLSWIGEQALEQVKEEYAGQIPEGCGFYLTRVHAEICLMGENVESLELHVRRSEKLIPVKERFMAAAGDREGIELVSFTHPNTGKKHTLYLIETEKFDGNKWDRMPADIEERFSLGIVYETVPPLPDGERLYLKDLYAYGREDSSRSCSIIGAIPSSEEKECGGGERGQEEGDEAETQIIGGASGPTAIFIAGKATGKEVQERRKEAFFTECTKKEQEYAKLTVVGIYTEMEPERDYMFQING